MDRPEAVHAPSDVGRGLARMSKRRHCDVGFVLAPASVSGNPEGPAPVRLVGPWR